METMAGVACIGKVTPVGSLHNSSLSPFLVSLMTRPGT